MFPGDYSVEGLDSEGFGLAFVGLDIAEDYFELLCHSLLY